MRVLKIEITNLRAFTHAEFEFQPGMNLLVGINGVGKTTVLDSLRISLSKILPDLFGIKGSKQSFNQSDIRIGAQSLQVSCNLIYNQLQFNLILKKQIDKILYRDPSIARDQLSEAPDIEIITPDLHGLFPNSKNAESKPLVIFFSTKRSILTNKQTSGSAVAGGQVAAFSESLLERETNLRTIAEWYKVQEELGNEKHNAVLRGAIELFLPEFKNLRVVVSDGKPQFEISKNGTTLKLTQLSDGERGILAMVLDLAKRLSQANPFLVNPIKDGSAIILIDELDLHLHPKWQRTIIENLTRTFPNCQFIATTHSPQIIGELNPENIIVIDKEIYNPSISFGIDSSRILEEILDTPSRNKNVNYILNEIYKNIDKGNVEMAKEYLNELKKILGPNDPEVTRSSTMLSFLEDELADETN
jgi:predicted ATP-binding protein involved in virulence